tara:strand:- start:595 stop:804 length:210 start_codon:yes stop_codon:yes gene_type:complete
MTRISINGVERDMTPEEEIEHTALQENAIEETKVAEANRKAKEDLKASAKAKLIAGEALTEEEANTIVL